MPSRNARRSGPSIGRAGLHPALAFFVLVTVPLLIAGFGNVAPADFWTEAGAAAGMVALSCILSQFATSGRHRRVSGSIGIDTTMAFHKWFAPCAVLLVIAHVAFLSGPGAPWDILRRSLHVITSPRLWDGTTALALAVGLIVLAFNRDRLPLRYGKWRLGHLILAAAIVGVSVYHALDHGTYAAEPVMKSWWWSAGLIAVATPVVHLVVRKFFQRPWRIRQVRKAGDGLWELILDRDGEGLPFSAGQFVWLRISSDSPWNDNPFSIASAPGHQNLTFLIREAGDTTTRLAAVSEGTEVTIDGPHGVFTLDGRDFDYLLLVAGGVGIAPIRSILEDLAEKFETRPVRLLYAGSARAGMLEPVKLWPLLNVLNSKSILLADDVCTSDLIFKQGPLKATHLAELAEGIVPKRTLAMICGPAEMTTFSADTLHKIGIPLRNILYERFSYNFVRPSIKDKVKISQFAAISGGLAALVLAFPVARWLLN